jgi:hypothetical protein
MLLILMMGLDDFPAGAHRVSHVADAEIPVLGAGAETCHKRWRCSYAEPEVVAEVAAAETAGQPHCYCCRDDVVAGWLLLLQKLAQRCR